MHTIQERLPNQLAPARPDICEPERLCLVPIVRLCPQDEPAELNLRLLSDANSSSTVPVGGYWSESGFSNPTLACSRNDFIREKVGLAHYRPSQYAVGSSAYRVCPEPLLPPVCFGVCVLN